MNASFTCRACQNVMNVDVDGHHLAADVARQGGWHVEQAYVYCEKCYPTHASEIPQTSGIVGGKVL